MASEAPLDKCLRTLKTSESDTEKFAALLVVTKLIKADDCSKKTRREVFEAIGFQFLRRLMKTAKTPDGCPDYSFKNLAIIILHSFCSDDELAQSPDMYRCLPQLNSIMSYDINHNMEQDDVSAQEAMIKECYECLICIANHEEGRLAMIKQRTVTALCHACIQKSYSHDHAEHLLHHLLLHDRHHIWDGNVDGFKVLVTHLSEKFAVDKTPEVFLLCTKLDILLSSILKTQLGETNPDHWSAKIHNTLLALMRSKLGKSQRNQAISLASVLVNLLGIEWAVGTTEESKKFLLILVHLACVEVRMILEIDLKLDEIDCEETSKLMSSLYLLLENIISYLSTGPTLQLDDRQFTQLHSAMVGAFKAVIFFLSEIATSYAEKTLHPVVVASVRVLGAWMAEETTALNADICKLLPFLLDVGRKTFYAARSLDEKPAPSTANGASDQEAPTEVLEQLTLTPAENQSGAEQTYDTYDIDVLRFLLPGLCHLTADDTARTLLKDIGTHVLLGEYFTYLWKQYITDGKKTESWVPIATLCGIFLNYVIIDPELASTHPVFFSLLEFAIDTLPGLVKSSNELTLTFNLAVLGLMILRRTGAGSNMPRGNCDKFFNAVIALYRRSHYVHKTKNGVPALAVSDIYQSEWPAVSELWFLGMQALSENISKCPSLTSCLLSSGWITHILKNLTELKGQKLPKEISMAFQNLLSSLASNNTKTKLVISEKGGMEIATAFKMKELATALEK